ncbi:hypothetical protein ACFQDE_00455 [Deinococcus caeni]|uniref:hypothetical protein n=1 Tax=Deinococcus caeni TaxID=569127 RepID=UPI00361AEE03
MTSEPTRLPAPDRAARPRRSLPAVTARTLTAALLVGGLALGTAALAQTATPAPAPATAQAADADRTVTLRPALSGERRYLTIPNFGRVAYYADDRGQGRPLILTSSVNAAASAYEMKPSGTPTWAPARCTRWNGPDSAAATARTSRTPRS